MLFIKICCHFNLVMEKLFNHPCAIHFPNGPVHQQTTTASIIHALKLTISYGYKPSKRGINKPKIHNHL